MKIMKSLKRKSEIQTMKHHKSESESETRIETSDEDEDEDEDDSDELYGTVYSKKKAFNILVSLDDPSYYERDDESETSESSERV